MLEKSLASRKSRPGLRRVTAKCLLRFRLIPRLEPGRWEAKAMKAKFSLPLSALLLLRALGAQAQDAANNCPTDVERYDQNGTITLNTSSMAKNVPTRCSITDAFQIVDDGGNFGTNSCGNQAKPSPDGMVDIDARGFTFFPQSELFLSSNGARVLGGTFDGGKSTRIFRVVGADAYLVLDGSTVENGKASSNGGGGVLVESGGRFASFNSRFIGNHADTAGAIMHQSYSEMIIYHTYFGGNVAEKGVAGAIRVSASDNAFIEHSRLANNKALLGGGGVYIESAILDVVNSYVENNEAGTDGGGILLAGDSLGSLSVRCTRVGDNRAIAGDGGGIFLTADSGTANIVESFIDGNRAEGESSGNGGGIFVGSAITIDKSSVSRNSAVRGGGGIFIHDAAADLEIHMENTTVAANTVSNGNGGGLQITGYAAGTVTDDPNSPFGKNYPFRILNSTIVGNKANNAQIFIEDAGAKTFGEILFLNNVVKSDTDEGMPGSATCQGLVDRLLTKLPGDPDPAATYNAQYFDKGCGTGFELLNAVGAQVGAGRFFQIYAPTTAPKPGLTAACDAVNNLDQFNRPAPCRLGSVRAGHAPNVADPFAPGLIF
jgi:hypothetical protein